MYKVLMMAALKIGESFKMEGLKSQPPMYNSFLSFCYAVGSIIMAVDRESYRWLVTADVDGLVKVWDVIDYCTEDSEEVYKEPPRNYNI